MIFAATPIDGLFLIEADPATDARGWFARIWCREEFER
ncbi:MAG: dTDP-4-dehydrorhamnose 3,5-epimerase family protein, partial [Candidatus Eremiobacteraeota bacterium]|nr:dTDP-4-dehydrorhamnose 3,5-epimerase family protein [Candidatus Eremiobacteraeota bacterium]